MVVALHPPYADISLDCCRVLEYTDEIRGVAACRFGLRATFGTRAVFMQADQFPRRLSRIAGTDSPALEVERRPRIVAISSGKGGVGKSSIAVNLGLTLARFGRRVCIFDADTGLANVNILLGLRPGRSLEHVLAGECPIEDIVLKGAHGLCVIPGANGISECVNLDAVRQQRLVSELSRIEGEFDYLLLDTAAGISETTLDFLGAADQVLLVITSEPTSLTDAFSLLKLALRRHPVSCEVVVNMAANFNDARNVFQRFHRAVAKYLDTEVSFLGFIQRDESMHTAVTLQRPVALFPETDPSSRPFQRLADALEGKYPQAPETPGFSRFWSRRVPDAQARPAAPASGAPDPHRADEHPDAAEAIGTNPAVDRHERPTTPANERDVFDAVSRPVVNEPRSLLDLGAHGEPSGRARAVVPDFEAHGGSTQREISEKCTALPTGAVGAAQVGQAPRPHFGVGEERLGERTALEGDERSIEPGVPHPYDSQRFGRQSELAERLRQMGPEDGPLLEWLQRR